MAPESTNLRIIKSRRVIAIWERNPPGGTAEGNMRMIREEIAILEQIIADHPEKALTVGDLIQRYRRLQESVKGRAH